MRVERIALSGFRNYDEETVEFSPAVNVICGPNAQGKTNLLEAVYILTGARSFRTRFDRELIGFDRDELMRAVSRVSLIIDERTKNPLRLCLEEDMIRILCTTGVGRGEDQCPVKGGGTLEIGFNNRYLLDALKAAPADTLKLCFNNASSPCVIMPADGSDSFSYMILPVRLKAGV